MYLKDSGTLNLKSKGNGFIHLHLCQQQRLRCCKIILAAHIPVVILVCDVEIVLAQIIV